VIVLDEQLHGASVRTAISAWYRGQVVSIRSLRPGTLIKDDAVAALLLGVPGPTFVTINVADFWHVIAAHRGYCVVAIELSGSQVRQLPALLRRLFLLGPFSTKAQRMGKVIRVTAQQIEYYDTTGPHAPLAWPGR
jgi:hypothetical protein